MNRNLQGRRRWRDLTRWQKTALSVSVVAQSGLAAAAWADLARRAPAQVRGPKWRWAALIAVNYAGPIAYFRWGRRRPAADGALDAGASSFAVPPVAEGAQAGKAAAGAATVATRTGPGEAVMEDHFVWMTTRRIKPGTLAGFEAAWRPGVHPEGMLSAYAYWSDDEQQIVGVSSWTSRQSCDAWRASDAEARRREAMAPYVLDEQEAFYRGRELVVPARY